MGCSSQIRMMDAKEQALAQAQRHIGPLSSTESLMLLAMFNRHTEDGVSLRELASESGHSTEWIATRFKILRRAIGAPEPEKVKYVKPEKPTYDFDALQKQYEAGASLADLERHTGRSRHFLQRAFRLRGIPMRSVNEAKRLAGEKRRVAK